MDGYRLDLSELIGAKKENEGWHCGRSDNWKGCWFCYGIKIVDGYYKEISDVVWKEDWKKDSWRSLVE